MAPPQLRPAASGRPLHIMCIGDSITKGICSSDGNGYRLPLLRLLQRWGTHENIVNGDDDTNDDDDGHDDDNDTYDNDRDVRFIGSRHLGNMTNNAHEGYGGATIRSITEEVRESLRERSPNVMLVHAGTNDLYLQEPPEPYETAQTRLGLLIDELLRAQPDAVVVVARIVQSSLPETRERIRAFNALVPAVVKERLEAGYRILLADMSSIGENGRGLEEGLHPDDDGYKMMAHVWLSALKEAGSRGWIKNTNGLPEHVDREPTCPCVEGEASTL